MLLHLHQLGALGAEADAAVHGGGLQATLDPTEGQGDAAVHGLGLDALALPVQTLALDAAVHGLQDEPALDLVEGDAAVHRVRLEPVREAGGLDGAIHRLEGGGAFGAAEGDFAVHRLQGGGELAGHPEGHLALGPPVVAPSGALGVDALDLQHALPGLHDHLHLLILAAGLELTRELDLRPVPSLRADEPVHIAHLQGGAGRQRQEAHFRGLLRLGGLDDLGLGRQRGADERGDGRGEGSGEGHGSLLMSEIVIPVTKHALPCLAPYTFPIRSLP